MLEYIKFYIEKAKFMLYFAWYRDWMLVSEEWKMTFEDLKNSRCNYEEYRQDILKILRKG